MWKSHQMVIQYWHGTTNSPSDCPHCHLDYLGATEGKKCVSFQQQAHGALAVTQRIEEESKNVIMAGAKHLAKLTT
jgi:hypothetical protein